MTARFYSARGAVVLRFLIAILLSIAGGGCASSGSSSARSYPLLSDGWSPGQAQGGAIFTGKFDADLTARGACAWLGPDHDHVVALWPVGDRVRFHPTELIGPQGQVLAKAGQFVGFRGDSVPPNATTPRRCGDPGKVVFLLGDPG